MYKKISFLAALLLCLLSAAPGFADDPLAKVTRQAASYAKSLADSAERYTAQDRIALARAARVLGERGHCGEALTLDKLLASGGGEKGYADWIGLATHAYCARSWPDAVNGAALALQRAGDDAQRQQALVLLGRSMEGHWSYGAGDALAVYRAALGYGALAGLEEKIAGLEKGLKEESSLRLDRHFVQDDGSSPAICLDFSQGMPEPGAQSYGDYIRFDPPFQPSFRLAAYDEVCAEGAEFGTDYRVRILPGLRGNEGAELEQPLDQAVQVGDRAATLWFENSLYVLPRNGGGVPVHGINAGKARLRLYRIGDRNLLHEFVRSNFRSDLDRYEANRIRDELGEEIWSGQAELVVRRNREAVTNLPVAPLMDPEPGVYVLTAEPVLEEGEGDEQGYSLAAQWLVVSDLGLASYRGVEGLTLVTRSLATAEPLEGVRLALYARNNRLLAETVSGASGVARFAAELLAGKGGREPDLLMAFGPGQDFNFFDLQGSAYDLSDRGVGGRPAPGPLDAFLYTDRGVYRPGDRVHLAALLRNDRGQALDGLPLTLRLLRPDEQLADEQVLFPTGAGGYSLELPVSASARTGRWKLLAYVDTKAAPVGQTAFLVEAIVPPRIEVEVTSRPDAPLSPGAEAAFAVQARYLFGAPGADLAASGEARVEADPNPFPDYPGYRFGPVDEPSDSVLLPLDAVRTDAQGVARFAFRIERLPKLRRPLRAVLRAEVADVDGRAVATSLSVPVRHQALNIGVKPPGQGGALAEGAEALFEVLALDNAGQPTDLPGLEYRLLEEQVDYQWYKVEGQWRYKRQVRDRLLREGKLALTAARPAGLGLVLESGRYRLELRDPASGVLTSLRVQAGWQSAAPDAETPDMLSLASDRDSYAPGDTARIHLEAPFVGQAELVIASDRVLEVRQLPLVAKTATLEVAMDPAWGAGAYALVTVYRPDGGETGHGPRRAIGVAWLGLRSDEHRLDIQLQGPDKTLPGTHLELPLTVSGQQPGEPVFLTLAAVDEGVLQLTDYQTPDPLGHYFGQRRLGVGVRDLYGRLIDGRKGKPGRIRSGGGASRKGTPDAHIRIVALFSGVVRLDAHGRAEIPLELPEYDGRLRLTAVAWSGERVGSARADLTVREPVVVMPSLPRFLAVGDLSQASVLIQNLDGPEGDYRFSWHTSGVLAGAGQAEPIPLTLTTQQREVLSLPLEALAVGTGSLNIELQGPGDTRVTRELKLGVRAPFLPETRRRFGRLEPGASARVGNTLAQGLRPETLVGLVSVSGQPDLDVPGLLRQLDLYPYGCLEQVTSRAFPLLHVQRLAQRWDYQSAVPVEQRMSEAVALILEKQVDNGGFALWNPTGEEEPWLSAYALDFLQRAREAGAAVPEFAWQRGLGWLQRMVEYPATDDTGIMGTQAYALYVLARAGEAHPETARYLLDQVGTRLPSRLAAAQLGAALALMGDAERAEQAFTLAADPKRKAGLRDYGSSLRDLAALVLLRSETPGDDPNLAEQVQDLAERMAEERWLSTQEQAWLVRAANAVTGDDRPLLLSVQGAALPERSGPLVLQPAGESVSAGVELLNRGTEAAWYSVAVTGNPGPEPPVLEQGFRIRRSLLNLQGEPVDLEQVHQGDLLLVRLDGQALTKDLQHQALIVDPLPAGLEAETATLDHARSVSDLAWLKKLSTTLYTEALDDRFVAALDLNSGGRFRVAYLVRAVTPGLYRLPPPEVEDMYKPRYRARGAAGWLNVNAAR